VGSLEFNAGQVRSGFALLALLSDEDLARIVRDISKELQKIEPSDLRKTLPAIMAESLESSVESLSGAPASNLFEGLLNTAAETDRVVLRRYPEIRRWAEKLSQWERWKADWWDGNANMTKNAVEAVREKDAEIGALREFSRLRLEKAAQRLSAAIARFNSTTASDRHILRKYPQIRVALDEIDQVRRTLTLAMSDHATDAPSAHGLASVAGMAELKKRLTEDIIRPLAEPELYVKYRVSIPNGILFYGPPGCGKTYVARALAEELGYFFQYCRPSTVASPFIHDTVKKVNELFVRAIENAPSVLFIDEFDAFVPERTELGGHQDYKKEEVNEFLANLEGCADSRVLVIAATNTPDRIDAAVRRSGRFDKQIYIPPPDAEARVAMLEFHLRDRPLEESIDIAGIAAVIEGYAASDVKLLADEAARAALLDGASISTASLLTALERVPGSISPEDLARYSSFRSTGL